MKIAIISFDQEFSKQLKEELEPDNEVRVYIDSLGMLRDLKEFHPDVIVYDASAGEFAIDDLKFLMTRDKLENNDFKIFISESDPINIDELPKKIKKEIFTKDKKGIEKFISKMKIAAFQPDDFEDGFIDQSATDVEDTNLLFGEEKESSKKDDSPLMQTPEDIEELFMGSGDIFEEEKEEKKEVKSKPQEESKIPDNDIFEEDIPIEDIESILGELGIEESEEEEKKEEVKESKKVKEEKPQSVKESVVEEKKRKTTPRDYLAEFEDFFTLEGTKKDKRDKSEETVRTVKEKKESEHLFPSDKLEEMIAEAVEESGEKAHIVSNKFKENEREDTLVYGEARSTGEVANVIPSEEGLKLEINISPEEIKQMIVRETVEKMVNELQKDSVLQELINDVQRSFIEKTERELEGLKEAVKLEIKSKLLKKIEEDLKESIKESIKKDVMEITTKLVKQKLEQLFGK